MSEKVKDDKMETGGVIPAEVQEIEEFKYREEAKLKSERQDYSSLPDQKYQMIVC